ncbi:MAG: hypothetical protein K8S54_18150 [Spirochaetia bacterium]|nr:hypothetical protein [Spirochaetia bacterium]
MRTLLAFSLWIFLLSLPQVTIDSIGLSLEDGARHLFAPLLQNVVQNTHVQK